MRRKLTFGVVALTALATAGIAGTYRKHEAVDIVYDAGGRRAVETGLLPKPYDG